MRSDLSTSRPAVKRKKRGFAVNVVDGWFRSSVSGTLDDLLLDSRSAMFELLRPEPVRALFEAHRSRSQDNHKLLFSLALFEQQGREVTSVRTAAHRADLLKEVPILEPADIVYSV